MRSGLLILVLFEERPSVGEAAQLAAAAISTEGAAALAVKLDERMEAAAREERMERGSGDPSTLLPFELVPALRSI
ncbi:MAG: hypothetical protein EOP23_21570 [Hyphomicrobiales bacterium]|nr:MAG: hypothetical protein EOP23_21570 [Hyphomicrobiales bacterium]